MINQSNFRFVLRESQYFWVHEATMLPDDIDCTEMNDEEFECLVINQQLAHQQ